MRRRSVAVLFAGSLTLVGAAGEMAAVDAPPREIYVISDLHMGLGRIGGPNGPWHRTEDFRWPRALAGFLDTISPPGANRGVDLVIAGDFLELWQPPAGIPCQGPNEDYGCSVAELVEITCLVLRAHAAETASLADFAARDDNCLYVVPGNHDAALMLDPVWALLDEELSADGGCVERAPGGVWVSEPDGRVVVEHGHQIGLEANRYTGWPYAITREFDGVDYIERPWGELFVQKRFNEEEQSYPLIDNLSPKSAGVRYRLADQGVGDSIEDAAEFLKFNLLDTSWRQQSSALGKGRGRKPTWDIDRGRRLGHELFALALAPSDPFREKLLSGDDQWSDLRRELDALALDASRLPDGHVRALCDQLALQKSTRQCARVPLGQAAQRLLFERGHVVGDHVRDRWKKHQELGIFAYGHTHAFEGPWKTKLKRYRKATVLNSGAFQRLIDETRLEALARAEGVTPIEFLERGSFDKIEPCYTLVKIRWTQGIVDPRVRAWVMHEDEKEGRFADPCGPSCPNVGQGCSNR